MNDVLKKDKNQLQNFLFLLKNKWKSLVILFVGITLTLAGTLYTKNTVKVIANQDFEIICNTLKTKLDARLKAHAQILRSGAALFAATDTVTYEVWKTFNEHEQINKNLPGIQGVGYSIIIPPNKLKEHIQAVRKNGFPDYNVKPEGVRNIYTSIIYLEPFKDRNLRAFGYDMYSEPVRRKAMELSRDSDNAILSDKVILVQETNEDLQAGSLMYVPVYRNGMLTNTIEERRAAITGWVYSPYRMNDLMRGILGNWDLPNKNRIRLKVYDNESISVATILYDSQSKDKEVKLDKSNLYLLQPIEFNGKKWILQFTTYNENLSIFRGKILIVLISGIAISILIFFLSIAIYNKQLHAEQILQLNIQLEKLNSDKNRFISILAHDLRSPFSVLLGFSDLLSTKIREYTIDEIEVQLNYIHESAIRIYNLLEDILIWIRSQSGKLPFNPQKLNLSTICTKDIENLKLIANNKNIKINYAFWNDLFVYADKNMLNTILRNLVSNAIKYTNFGGKIDIYAEQNKTHVTITVSDNGVGIDSETMAKLFEISQIQTTEGTAKEKGTGLGLLICKEFVEINGGKIWVTSTLGKGSDFKFTVPTHVTFQDNN